MRQLKAKEVLLVGGSADGTIVTVPDDKTTYEVHTYVSPQKRSYELYRIQEIEVGVQYFAVGVFGAMTFAEALSQIFAGYSISKRKSP